MPWIVAAASCLAVLLLIAPLKRWLEGRAVLDLPNPRSSNLKPVARGAGLVVIPVIVVAWAALHGVTSAAALVPLLALLLDRKSTRLNSSHSDSSRMPSSA